MPAPAEVNALRASDGASAAVVATHPGVLPAEAYSAIAEAMPADVDFGVLDLAAVPEYRHATLSGEPLPIDLSDIAERFAAGALEFAAGRPYALVGWSFGGVIGYAVAEAASDEQAAPALLLLLDSIAPGAGNPGAEHGDAIPDAAALYWFSMYFAVKQRTSLDLGLDDFAALNVDEGIELIRQRCIDRGALTPDTSARGVGKVFQGFLTGMLRNKSLQDRYTPGPPRWPTALLRPERSLIDDVPDLGWAATVPDLAIHDCGGDHYTLLGGAEPARRISDLVAGALDRVAPTH